jgi:hypothetical protein
MGFRMPWSPTQHFPHPLASMDRNESDPNFGNYISYTMMELLAWQGYEIFPFYLKVLSDRKQTR